MKKYIIDWVLVIALLISLVALTCSCSSIKKAERQTHRNLLNYPGVVAKIARDAFPCYVIRTINKTDSADFKKWKDSVDIINAFYNDLFNHIEPTLIHDTTNNCREYKDNEIKFRQKIEYQKKLIAELNNKIDKTPPIKDSTKNWFKDSADIKILQLGIDNQNMTIAKMQHIIEADEETINRKNKMILYLWLAVAVSAIGIIIKLLIKFK